MNATITLTLKKSKIIESVKNETFYHGQVIKSADQKSIAEAYNEQAGDEAYHEAILSRAMYTHLEELKTHLSAYLSSLGLQSAGNITTTENGDDIVLAIVVGGRFNKGYATPLARLSSKYIEEAMLMEWWKPVNEKQSALYSQFVERELANIKRCFISNAPSAPVYRYPSELSVSTQSLVIGVGEQSTITYTISDGSTDDIAICANPCKINYTLTEGVLTIEGRQKGKTYVTLYSRHNPELCQNIIVTVSD